MDYIFQLPSLIQHDIEEHIKFLTTPHTLSEASTLWKPWLVQVIMSWVGFTLYMVWDYNAYRNGTINSIKLPTHFPVDQIPDVDGKLPPVEYVATTSSSSPSTSLSKSTTTPTSTVQPRIRFLHYFQLSPFWFSQLFMCPLVLFNQFIIWPVISLFIIWPQWARHYRPIETWSSNTELIIYAIILFLISDTMWYWSHRLMHVPWFWKHWHKMHHVAPQCAISATYVHPGEYAMWCIAMQLPWAIAGYPLTIYLWPLGWGMMTGSGAHSGYGDTFANGTKHNAHHFYHNVNFGLLMICDMIWGTHWAPGDPPPRNNPLMKEVDAEHPDIFQIDLVADDDKATTISTKTSNKQPKSSESESNNNNAAKGTIQPGSIDELNAVKRMMCLAVVKQQN